MLVTTFEGRYMTTADVPADGEVRIGATRLPAGRRVRSNGGRGEPVAWVTTEPVQDAGRVWAALSDVHAQSGLVPFLLSGIAGGTERPWDSQEFRDRDDLTELDHLDAAEFLQEQWRGRTTEYDDYDEEDEEYDDDEFASGVAEEVAPFSRRQFPGLAKAEDHELDAGQFDRVLSGLGQARVGLVPAGRPADAVPLLGWNEAFVSALSEAAVLRSWEDRFGARLLRVGFAEISVLARRPPSTPESASQLAAEQWAFCDEFGGTGLHDVPGIAASLMNSPVWTFWWD
jgi:Domain of unknown function (DUF4253)